MKHWLSHRPLPCYAPADAPAGGAPVVDEPVVAAVSSEVPAGGEAAPAGDQAPAQAEPVATDAAAQAPVVDAHAQTSMLESVVVDPAKGADAPAVPDAAPKAPDAAPAGEAKPAEAAAAAPAEAPKPDAAAAPAAPVVAPVEYKFEFPEGITISDDNLKPAVEAFQKHGIAPAAAQELVGLYVDQMQKMQASSKQEQHRMWADTRKQWRDEVLADPQLGGSGHQTAMQAVARMRDKLVQASDMPAFNHMLTVTGVGDHPMFLKVLHTAARLLDEPAAPSVSGNPTAHNGTRKTGRLRDTYQS
ncbi:MAG: hypothetical protein WCP82_04560 [Alphaproteobacteria bacterium]